MSWDEDVEVVDEIIFNVKSKDTTDEGNSQVRRSFNNESPDSFSFKRKKKALTPEERKKLEELYSVVVVHDYGDEYHLSEEERKQKFRYYEAFSRILRCKRKYRKLDEFVTVYRLCLDCLKLVAETNEVYAPQKFIRMVLRKEIKVFGLNFPKYVGKDKKDINWEYISQFIMDYSKDPKELVAHSSSLSELDEDEIEEMLFTEEEIKRINELINNPPEDKPIMPFDEDDIGDNEENLVIVADGDSTQELVERVPEIVKVVKDATKLNKKRNAMDNRLNSFVFEMNNDDFDAIAQMDRDRHYESDSDLPVFKGDISSKKDFKRYMYQLSLYEDEQIKENYNGKMRSHAEIREIELKEALEADGWNIRNLYNNKDLEKKLKKARKRDKKQEKKLKAKLVEIQDRNKKKYGKSSKKGNKDIEFDCKKKHKKNKKKKDKESD